MVILNEFLPINIFSLKTNLIKNILNILDNRIDYYIETEKPIKKNDKKNIFDNITEDIKNLIYSDHFLYLIMDDNYCTHKYKRGKNEGKFCAKKIKSNNPNKVYLCCQHDKDHIPKKRIKKEKDDNLKNIEDKNDNNYDNKNNSMLTIKNKVDNINNVKLNDNFNIQNSIKKEQNKMISKIKLNDIKITSNNMYYKGTNNINKNKNKNKYIKKREWKKLDIIYDTGFIFIR